MRILAFIFCSLSLCLQVSYSQSTDIAHTHKHSEVNRIGPFSSEPSHTGPCLLPEQRSSIQEATRATYKDLLSRGIIDPPNGNRIVSFDWPLQNSASNSQFEYFGISNYVDHDLAFNNSLEDYDCGTKTYDTGNYNHQGIDIQTWPFRWNYVQDNAVEVIAAEGGTIIGKEDGNTHTNCDFSNPNWNAVYVSHSDGSVAWYGHMKNGSLTNKNVGQTVAAGEYLGVVASSGYSTGPHLHFEVYTSTSYTDLIDPYEGPCNSLNSDSWWANQKPYWNPRVSAMHIHTALPDFGSCPELEVTNIVTNITAGQPYLYMTYYHDQRSGDITNHTIRRPNGTVFTDWNSTSNNNYNYGSYWNFSRTIPESEPAGTWTYEIVYNGDFYSIPFTLINNSACTDPSITGSDITCMGADSYDLAVTFVGESGETYNITGSQSGPAGVFNVTSGTYTIFGNDDNLVQSITVANANDPTCETTVNILSGNCDLTDDYFTSDSFVSDSSPEVGQDITLSCTQDYSGNSSILFTVEMGYLLSVDQFSSNDDIFLGLDASLLSSSNPSEFESIDVTVPNVSPGAYFVLFCADYPDDYEEANENNNCSSLQIQVEDSTPPCIAPTGLFTSGVTTNSATAEWSAAASATEYIVSWGIQGQGYPNSDTVDVTSYDIGGLLSNTTYCVRLQSICNGALSPLNTISCFTTLDGCPDLIIENLEINSNNVFEGDITNIGDATAVFNNMVVIQNYVSADTIYDNGNDLPSGGFAPGYTLEPGESQHWIFGTLNQTDVCAYPYGISVIDRDNALAECDETNNTAWVQHAFCGCTDVSAHNYDPEAEQDDGSCETCEDGILNGDETEIDCGGSLCEPCFSCTLSANPIPMGTTCGEENGSIVFNVSGAQGSVTILLNGIDYSGLTFADNLAPGDYSFEVTDAAGCTVAFLLNIADSDVLDFVATTTSADCGMPGSISVDPFGSIEPFSISIDNGPFQDGTIVSNLGAGVYLVTLMDGNGCTSSQQVSVDGNDGLIVTAIPVHTSCGLSNGGINVQIIVGNGGYVYTLQPNGTPQSSGFFSDLTAGDYSILVTDDSECEVEVFATIDDSDLFILEVGFEPTTCDEDNGSLELFTSGGTSPILYSIDNGPFSEISFYNGLPAGTYNIEATDANNCIANMQVTIDDSEGLELVHFVTDATCGQPNGVITFDVVTGTFPFEYYLNGLSVGGSGIISGLAAGTYEVGVQDAAGCVFEVIVEVGSSQGVDFDFETTATTCGLENGAIEVFPLFGQAPYLYSVNGSVPTAATVYDNLPAGLYSVEMFDSNDCSYAIEITVEESPIVSFDLEIQPSTCGDFNGSITVSPTGGVAPYTFSFGIGFYSTPVLTDISGGTYLVAMMDNTGCVTEEEVFMDWSTPIDMVVEVVPENCGAVDAEVILEVVNGSQPISYVLQSGAYYEENDHGNFEFLSSGIYDAMATDADGCIVVNSVEVGSLAGPEISFSTENASCNASNGSFEYSFMGGTAPYVVTFDGEDITGTSTVSSLPSGTYELIITDIYNCQGVANVVIEEDAYEHEALVTDAVCVENSGSVQLVISGSMSTFTYELDGVGSNTTGLFENLAAGDYTYTVEDENECIQVGMFTIEFEDSFSIEVSTEGTDCGQATGQIIVVQENGVAPLIYTLNGDLQNGTGVFNNLQAGTYSVFVQDGNACTREEEVVIEDEGAVSLDVMQVENASCAEADGYIEVAASNGTAPYQFVLNGTISNSTGVFEMLQAGDYTIRVTDDLGCESEVFVGLVSDGLTLLEVETVDANCNMDDGSITINSINGVAPYIYRLNDVVVTTLGDLSVGAYELEVEDALGCTLGYDITIENVGDVALSASSIVHPSLGGSNGSFMIIAEGGTAPYSFEVGGAVNSTGIFENLGEGAYVVVVTDAENCESSIEVVLEASQDLVLAFETVNETCMGANGMIECLGSGGLPPYAYQLEAAMPQASSVFADLPAGTYQLTIYDAEGTEFSTSASIENEGNVQAVVTVTNASCGEGNGSIGIELTEGIAPFEYYLEGVVTDPMDMVNLVSGTYNVSILDADNCEYSEQVIVSEVGAFDVIAVPTGSSCGDDNGSISMINVNGADLVYSINGATYQEVGVFTNLQAGIYQVESLNLEDSCKVFSEVEIIGSPPLAVEYTITSPDCGADNGMIVFDVTGGTGSIVIKVDEILLSGQLAEGLAVGSYIITIEDDMGCTLQENISIEANAAGLFSVESESFSICGDECSGEMTIVVDSSVDSYRIFWPDGASSENTNLNLCAGTYNIPIEYNETCTEIVNFTIEQSLIYEPEVIVVDANCNNNNGVIYLQGASAFEVTWEDSSVGSVRSNVAAGEYTFSITDEQGCERFETIEIEQLGALDILTEVNSISCFGEVDGSIELNVSGSLAPYSIIWENGNTGFDLEQLAAGIYYATVTDSSTTCSKPIEIEIYEPALLEGTLIQFGTNSVLADVIGGTQPYSYLWSTGETSSIIEIAEGASYSVEIMDANGCTTSMMQTTTATEDGTTKELEVFPNPFMNLLYIRGESAQSAVLKVYDMRGQVCNVKYNKHEDNRIELDFRDYDYGVYNILLINEGEMQWVKVLHLR